MSFDDNLERKFAQFQSRRRSIQEAQERASFLRSEGGFPNRYRATDYDATARMQKEWLKSETGISYEEWLRKIG